MQLLLKVAKHKTSLVPTAFVIHGESQVNQWPLLYTACIMSVGTELPQIKPPIRYETHGEMVIPTPHPYRMVPIAQNLAEHIGSQEIARGTQAWYEVVREAGGSEYFRGLGDAPKRAKEFAAALESGDEMAGYIAEQMTCHVLPGDTTRATELARTIMGGYILDDFRHMDPVAREILSERLPMDLKHRVEQILHAYVNDPFKTPDGIKLLAFLPQYGFSAIPEDSAMGMVKNLLNDTSSAIANGVRRVAEGIKEIGKGK